MLFASSMVLMMKATLCDTTAPGDPVHQDVHPLGSQAKVLLSSIFGPYARNDMHGSRAINPMELYHNQVTRLQGPFSLRMFHRSCGLKLIQANISACCDVLDYPSLERFAKELTDTPYDIIGISAIPPNLKKVAKMCRLIRRRQPTAKIIVGGHIANMKGLDQEIDADYIVRGEGVRWFRKYLGQDPKLPICHPLILSAVEPRCMGMKLSSKSRDTAAVLMPSVGCPIGCDFCSTSATFGGKGSFINFYQTGDALFDVMTQLERQMNVNSFFVMDENFLLHKRRAMRLRALMEAHEKSWSLHVFSSVNALQSYTMDQLLELGISWVWIGLEGHNNPYEKLRGADTKKLVRDLQSEGIVVLGSSIIGLDDHTLDNLTKKIDWAIDHRTDFHQFMLKFAPPGTPLYKQLSINRTLFAESELEHADVHGQYRFNFCHPHIPSGMETEWLLKAFQKDLDVNGPSVVRLMETALKGWKRHKDHPKKRIRKRYCCYMQNNANTYASALWAVRLWYINDRVKASKLSNILKDYYGEFGLKCRLLAPLLGMVIFFLIFRENRRLALNRTYEPPTFFETDCKAVCPENLSS